MEHTENVHTSGEVRRFRRRLGRVLVADRALKLLAASGFAWGVVVLAARAGLGTSNGVLLAGLVLVLTATLAMAVLRSLRALPAEAAVRALLDRRQRRGGLLMAQAETELGAWRPAGDGEPPDLVWRSGSAWTFFLGAAVFVAVAFLVPAGAIDASTARPLDIGEEIEDLVESLEVLEEEELLDADEAERLELELETLAREASGDDPARAWETLDQLRAAAEQTAAEAAESALAEGEQLAAAFEVAEALSEAGGPPELEAEALGELAEMAARAAQESQLLDRGSSEALSQAAGARDLDALREALGQGRSDVEAKLERLHEAGLVDLETLLGAKKALEPGDQALSEYLDENGYTAAGGYCMRPGRGGTDRGRGDAPMTWGEESTSQGAEFEERVLDPASLAALEKNGLIGLQAVDPTAGGRQPLAAAGTSALDPSSAGGGAAYKQTVLPRHRGAVRRFFEREQER